MFLSNTIASASFFTDSVFTMHSSHAFLFCVFVALKLPGSYVLCLMNQFPLYGDWEKSMGRSISLNFSRRSGIESQHLRGRASCHLCELKAWTTRLIPGQPEVQSEILSKKFCQAGAQPYTKQSTIR